VCLIAAHTGVALVPYGHSRFCISCAETVPAMDSGCPICRSPIQMVLRVFNSCNIANYYNVWTHCIQLLCISNSTIRNAYFEMINCYVKHFRLISSVCCFWLYYHLVHHFAVLHFPAVLFSPSFSSPAFSGPVFQRPHRPSGSIDTTYRPIS